MSNFVPVKYQATGGGFRYQTWCVDGLWYVMRVREIEPDLPSTTQVLQTDGWVMSTKRQAGKDRTFHDVEGVSKYLGILLDDNLPQVSTISQSVVSEI